jgi:hypothetical protein
MVAPLKLEGTGGDLKEMTTAEEYWLAYQAGLGLADMASNDVAALTGSAGGTSIGSYSNTFYNQAVGTHPGASLSIGTTTTTIYQNTGTASEVGITRPTKFTTSGTRLDELDDTGFNEIADRLIAYMFANSYPGTYQLASSSPGGTYDTHLAAIFSDTRTDGTTVAYNIYQVQSLAVPPSAVRPIKLNDASGNLKEMSDAEIKLTFGQRVKTRIMAAANGIGAYQLRTSGEGVPVATGTWVAKGTATDTRNTTADANYSATYSADYEGTYSAVYSATYQTTRITNYTDNFVGTYTNPNAINYTRNRQQIRILILNYAPGPQTYIGDFIGDYLGVGYYEGAYVGDFVGDFLGDYEGNYEGNYTGTYTGNYTGNYDGETIGAGTGTIETYTLYVRTA